MSKKKPLRSFWDFEPNQTNKRNPFAVDPDFDAKDAKQDDKGPAITSLPRAMMKSAKKPLTKQKQQHIAVSASTPQKSGGGVWMGMAGAVAAVLILSQTKVLKNVTTFFNAKIVEDITIKPSTGPVLGEVNQEAVSPKAKPVAAKATVSTSTTPTSAHTHLIGKKVTVKTPFLNVRSDAGLSAPVVGNVKQGDEVTVLGAERSWLQIGEGRYIGASHIYKDSAKEVDAPAVAPVVAEEVDAPVVAEQKEKPAPKKAVATPKKKFVQHQQIATENIKIRTGAGPKNKVVGYLRKGTVVTVYEQKGIWLKIGDERYVHSGNLKPKDGKVGH